VPVLTRRSLTPGEERVAYAKRIAGSMLFHHLRRLDCGRIDPDFGAKSSPRESSRLARHASTSRLITAAIRRIAAGSPIGFVKHDSLVNSPLLLAVMNTRVREASG
jgi:hypothetical protein